MDELKRFVTRAQRRLFWQRFVEMAGWACAAALLISLLLVGIDKFRPLGVEPWAWPAAAAALGLTAAAIRARLQTRDELAAAIEVDRRFGLKERVSSSIAMAGTDSPASQAVIDDARDRVRRLNVASQFRVVPTRATWLPLMCSGAAVALLTLWQPPGVDNPVVASAETQALKKQVKQSTETLHKRMVERKEEAKEKGLAAAEELFDKLEAGTKRLTESDAADRKQALTSLNDLARELQQRRQSLGGGEQLRQQLDQMKRLAPGPADKLGQAVGNGDMKAAIDEMQKLREAIDRGQLDEKAKEQLAKQLAEMQQKVRDAIDKQRKAEDDLKQQLAEAKQQGDSQRAGEIEQKLSELSKQASQREGLEKLANDLGQAAKSMNDGDKEKLETSLDGLSADLDNLQDQLAESSMLDDAMDEIAQAKERMKCGQCQGQGCKECQGRGGDNEAQGGKEPGTGRGRRFGDDTDVADNGYDTRVRQKVGKGSGRVVDLVEGPNVKGKVEQEIRTQWEAAGSQGEDPLAEQSLPRALREHAKTYFDTLREGPK